ncbi:MAG: acyltransferase family protein [Gammaproteobacteria bacterium]|nr:acyltransferase family protein [Gammaproteobacteria bacterium]
MTSMTPPTQPPEAAERPADPRAATTRIEGLDGLRALSIAIVLIGHGGCVARHPQWLAPLRTVGVIGVELFLGISGFLITHLMVREHQKSGRLDLRRFWARRALRILPPLAAMMAGFSVAAAGGLFQWSWSSFLGALTFTRDLQIFGADWFFGHTWSLSMEEQFYAIWPLLFVGLRARRNLVRGLLGVILAAPVIALICEFRWGPVRNVLPFVPYLAVGCLLALLMQADRHEQLRRLRMLPHRGPLLAVLIVAACLVAWLRNQHGDPWLWVPLDALLMPVTLFLVLTETVLLRGRWTRLLSWTPLRAVGQWSYSIYLWQQLFFGPEGVYRRDWVWSTWPYNIVAALGCGALSYWLIERGSGRLKSFLIG